MSRIPPTEITKKYWNTGLTPAEPAEYNPNLSNPQFKELLDQGWVPAVHGTLRHRAEAIIEDLKNGGQGFRTPDQLGTGRGAKRLGKGHYFVSPNVVEDEDGNRSLEPGPLPSAEEAEHAFSEATDWSKYSQNIGPQEPRPVSVIHALVNPESAKVGDAEYGEIMVPHPKDIAVFRVDHQGTKPREEWTDEDWDQVENQWVVPEEEYGILHDENRNPYPSTIERFDRPLRPGGTT